MEVGIRIEVDARTGEIKVVQRDLDRLRGVVGKTGKEMARAERGAKGFFGRLRAAHGRIASYGLIGGALTAIGFSAKALVKGVVDANLSMDRLETRLAAGGRGAKLAADDIDYLRRKSEDLGLVFSAISDPFAGFAAAVRGTDLESQTRAIFDGVVDGAAALKLSEDDTRGVLLALEQMVSKGIVSAEELRGQLGERLPGAFRLAAEALGVTTRELDDMLKRGAVTADDLLPKLARALSELYGADARRAAQDAQGDFARLKNAIYELGVAAGETGLVAWLADVAGAAAEAATALAGVIGEQTVDGLPAREHGAWRLSEEALEAEMERLALLVRRQGDLTFHHVPLDAGARAQARFEASDAQVRKAREERAGNRLLPELLVYAGGGGGTDPYSRYHEFRAVAAARRNERLAVQPQAGDGSITGGAESGDGQPPDTSAADQLVAAYRRRVEGLQELTHAERAEIEIRELGEDVTERHARSIRRDAAALDAATVAARKKREAEEARTAQQDAAAAALAEYGGALAEVTHEERARALVAAAGAELQADPAEIIQAARALDEQAAAQARLNEAIEAERTLRESTEAVDGAKRALADFADYAGNAAANVEDAIVSAFNGAEDALTQFVLTGKASFSDFVDSLAADLTRLAIRQLVLAPVADALGGVIGRRSGGGSGGGAGKLGFPSTLGGGAAPTIEAARAALRPPAGVIAAPPRLGAAAHGAAAATGGARPSANGAPNVEIVVQNDTGRSVALRETGRQFDGKRWVIGTVLEDIANDGDLAHGLANVFGVRRVVT